MTNRREKWCPRCEAHLNIKAFGINRTHDDGLQTWCKDCISTHNKEKAEKNREKWAGRDPYGPGE